MKDFDRDEKLLKGIGGRIKSLRRAADLTQPALAELAGMHRSYITEIEQGRRNPSIRSIAKLAAALEVDLATFFGDAAFVESTPTGAAREVPSFLAGDIEDLAARAVQEALGDLIGLTEGRPVMERELGTVVGDFEKGAEGDFAMRGRFDLSISDFVLDRACNEEELNRKDTKSTKM